MKLPALDQWWMNLPIQERMSIHKERLGFSGSGADSCYDGREAGEEQGAAEARSGERRRVTPVEARENLRVKMEWWVTRSAMIKMEIKAKQSKRDPRKGQAKLDAADLLGAFALDILNTLPEPESVAPIHQSAPSNDPALNTPETKPSPRDERSGRRNAPVLRSGTPERSEQ